MSVQALPRIVTQLAGVEVLEGSSALLSVAATGAPLEIVSQPVSVSAKAGGVVVLGVAVTAGKRTFAWFGGRRRP